MRWAFRQHDFECGPDVTFTEVTRSGGAVAGAKETYTSVNGHLTRVWRKGSGPKVGFLGGFGGLPRWTLFLDLLAKDYTVIVPSLPGFPGGGRGHSVLDSHLDWIVATREILVGAGLKDAHALIGSSVGASLAAEVAALWPESAPRLVLIAPFGIFDEQNPPADPWAKRADELAAFMCADPQKFVDLRAPPAAGDSVEWSIEQARAIEASARIFWPLGETRLRRRLHLITSPTLLLWGECDRVVPADYARLFASDISGSTEIRSIPGVGHLAELDEPEAVSRMLVEWIAVSANVAPDHRNAAAR